MVEHLLLFGDFDLGEAGDDVHEGGLLLLNGGGGEGGGEHGDEHDGEASFLHLFFGN